MASFFIFVIVNHFNRKLLLKFDLAVILRNHENIMEDYWIVFIKALMRHGVWIYQFIALHCALYSTVVHQCCDSTHNGFTVNECIKISVQKHWTALQLLLKCIHKLEFKDNDKDVIYGV